MFIFGVILGFWLVCGIYLTAMLSALLLTKLFARNRPLVRLLIGGSIALLVAALQAPWYIDRVFGVSGNILKSTGAIAAAAIPVMVTVVVYSTVKRSPLIVAILAGAIAIPIGWVVLAAFACMAGDCL